jgi:probable phosphoglycerate mutase
MLLYVIRHGDPVYDPDSLTEKGHLQARALAKRLAVNGLDKIYTSPLIRAQQTAQPTCELLGIKPEIADWTSEGHTWQEFTFEDPELGGSLNWCFHVQTTRYKTPAILALGDKWYEAEPFCFTKAKEGYERIMRESDAFIEKLGYKREGMNYRVVRPNDDRVAVFCHQGFGTTWLSHLLSIPPVLYWSTFDMNHSSMTIIEFKNTKDGNTAPICLAVSDTSHIYAEGLPLQFANRIDI